MAAAGDVAAEVFDHGAGGVTRLHGTGVKIAQQFEQRVQVGTSQIKPHPGIGLFSDGCGVFERGFQIGDNAFMGGKRGFDQPLIGGKPKRGFRRPTRTRQGDVQGVCGFSYVGVTPFAGGE